MRSFAISPLIAAAIVLFAIGVFAGRASRDHEVELLKSSGTAGTLLAGLQTTTLHTVTGILKAERMQREQQRERGIAAVAQRADRHATIDEAAAKATAKIKQRAQTHDDCLPLRDLPICDVVADRLFGELSAPGAE